MLGEAIGDLLPAAVGVALSPVPIVAVILMLGTPRARANGPAFAAGWVLGLGAVTAIVLLVADDADSSDDTSTVASVVILLFGLVLLLLAVEQWQGRPRPGAEPEMPRWRIARIRERIDRAVHRATDALLVVDQTGDPGARSLSRPWSRAVSTASRREATPNFR